MKLENIRYIELTFINDLLEIKKQIRNTILFLYLAEQHGLSVLSDYLDGTQYGYTASAKKAGEFKLLRITDINEGKVDWESVPYCDCDNPAKYLLKENDILVARTGGTTGKSFIVKDVPSNAVYASYLIRLRIKKENNSNFISAYLNSYAYWSQLVELKRGAAQPNVNAEKLKKILIPECPPEIQKKYISYLNGDQSDEELDSRINEILSLFDDNQELKKEYIHQLDLLKKLRQQILQDAVQGKLVPQDPNDEPACEFLERIKAKKEKLVRERIIKKEKPLSPIRPEEIPFQIPENWVWCRLGEIAHVSGGKRVPNGYQLLKTPTNHGYIRITDMKNGTILRNDLRYISNEVYEGIKNYIIQKEDLYITIAGTIGQVGEVPDYFDGMNLTENAARIRLCLIHKTFIKYCLNSKYCQIQFIDKTKAMAQPKLALKRIETTLIAMPPINEQNRLSNKIIQLMTLCDELEQSIQQNQQYTQDLLQVALKEALESKPN